MGLQIPPTFCISSLKKNAVENYGAPDPANFLHQPAPSKRIRRKLLGLQIPPTFSINLSKRIWRKIMGLQISPTTFCISSLKKNLAENYMAPDPARFF